MGFRSKRELPPRPTSSDEAEELRNLVQELKGVTEALKVTSRVLAKKAAIIAADERDGELGDICDGA